MGKRGFVRWAPRLLMLAALSLISPAPASAYSVLAHEAVVDTAWDDVIAPLLRQRFPKTTAADLQQARAFAYGGSVIQDLGYYPFGNKLFTDLVHYVRSGDFVETLVREAQTVDELAFALGAVSHYASDNIGHPVAVNKSVPIIYPKLRSKFGNDVIYAEDPKRHVMVEFAFDVVQTATGAYLPDSHRQHIGFELAMPVLERAFVATYGIAFKELFGDSDLAIGTFRYAVSQLIPEMTRVAWKHKQDDIRQLAPTVQPNAFVYSFTRRQYEQAYGTKYRKPGVLARFIGLLTRVMPKIGPLSALKFRVPTPAAEKLFAESFRETRERYRALIIDARDGRVQLPNTDFDVGRAPRWGENAVADRAYVELLERLAERNFASTPAPLKRAITQFFAQMDATQPDKKLRKKVASVRTLVTRLNAL
ncbi:MAG TPA: zinc dependent phospholipase C family protein [Vicinamibacterales bacterium]|nr:zinc dependent phospholipase C family protein [Vicinamibacterales bacterium]